MDSTSMSPADFNALMGNANGFGGNGAWWLILLFLFLGNRGWGGGDYGQYATAASQQEILFGQRFSNLDNKIDRIGNGIADATFALNNTIHNAQDVVAGAVVGEGRGIQMQIGTEARNFQQQLNGEARGIQQIINEGICGTNRNIDALRYDARQNTGDIVAAIHADGEATRALIQRNKEQDLRDRIAALEMDNRMCGVVRYPMTYAYSAGQSPFCNCNCNCG